VSTAAIAPRQGSPAACAAEDVARTAAAEADLYAIRRENVQKKTYSFRLHKNVSYFFKIWMCLHTKYVVGLSNFGYLEKSCVHLSLDKSATSYRGTEEYSKMLFP
jgi:hypothetical protein